MTREPLAGHAGVAPHLSDPHAQHAAERARRGADATPAPPLEPAALARVSLGLAAGAVLVAVAAVAWTGAAAPTLLADAGPLVRWGLPVLRAGSDVAAALTVGLLVLAAVALPSPARNTAWAPALRAASAAAGAWALLTVLLAVLTYADVAGDDLSQPGFGAQLVSFVTTIDLGRGLLVTAGAALLVNLAAALASSQRAAGLLSLLALVALIPPALAGHAAGSTDHETAVTSLGLHLLGVCVWVGGLAGLVLLRRGLGDRLGPAVERYSTLAGWAFAVVAASGVLNAWIRLGGWSGLASRYGVLVLLKVAALVGLGAAGWWHRTRTLPAVHRGEPGAFARLAGVEAAVMAVAIGVAVALARTGPPVSRNPTIRTAIESITGYPLPPAPTAVRWLTVWQPDLLWVVLIALGAGLYTAGLVRLRRRGDRWPVYRTICWATGLVILTWVTCGAPAAYGRVLFSAHMVGHMTLSMGAPMFLVLGAPVTLLLRAARPRTDGTRGPREWTLAVLDSGYLRLLAHPITVMILFAGSLVVFYYSRLFPLALSTHVGHELMHVHFLFAGYLMAWLMMGVDPGPRRPQPLIRLVILFVTMGFHAFFGVGLIQGTGLLAPGYFTALGRPWGLDPLLDQQFGGGLAWGIGEFPTLVMAMVLAVQWTRDDARESRRSDRAADRDGDADLVAYNAMLAGIAADDERRQTRETGQTR